MVEQAAQGWADIASKRLEALEEAQGKVTNLQEKLAAADQLISRKNQEIAALNSRLAGKDEIIAELGEQLDRLESELEGRSVANSQNPIPEAADLLNQLKARRKKSNVTLADIEAILEMMEE
jgi:chromosome segregation ATPase